MLTDICVQDTDVSWKPWDFPEHAAMFMEQQTHPAL